MIVANTLAPIIKPQAGSASEMLALPANNQYNKVTIMKSPTPQQLQRTQDLLAILRTIYTAAIHEEDKERLNLLLAISAEAMIAFNEAADKDNTILEPNDNLGLELQSAIGLKRDGEREYKTYMSWVEGYLEDMGA